MKKLAIGGLIAIGAAFALTLTASAAYTLFGDAEIVSPGNASNNAAELSSDSTSDGFGGVRFTVPAGTSVADIHTLGTDYLVVAGDCAAGSPRFQVRVDMDDDGLSTAADKNIFVYIGPAPFFTACPAGWQTTGSLIDDEDLRVDNTQVGGAFYDTWANSETLVGGKTVLSVSLVLDSYWSAGNDPQTFDFDNVVINDVIETFEPPVPESKDDCKKGGWENLFRTDGTAFKNQGDCIQYVNTGK